MMTRRPDRPTDTLSPLDRELHTALARGASNGLDRARPIPDILADGADPLCLCPWHDWTPAMRAAKEGDIEALRLLIPFGGLDRQWRFGENALMVAAAYAHPECIEALIPHGGLRARNEDGLDALMLAAEQGNLRHVHEMFLLLIPGSDLNAVDKDGENFLMKAARHGCPDSVAEAAKHCDIFARNFAGGRAASIARAAGRLDNASLLDAMERAALDAEALGQACSSPDARGKPARI